MGTKSPYPVAVIVTNAQSVLRKNLTNECRMGSETEKIWESMPNQILTFRKKSFQLFDFLEIKKQQFPMIRHRFMRKHFLFSGVDFGMTTSDNRPIKVVSNHVVSVPSHDHTLT